MTSMDGMVQVLGASRRQRAPTKQGEAFLEATFFLMIPELTASSP